MKRSGAKHASGGAASKKLAALMKHVLSDVTPSKEEEASLRFAANEVMGRLVHAAPKYVEIMLAGSAARGTQVSGSSDIDIFLLFPRKMDERTIEESGLRIGKSIVDKRKGESYIVKYAEHPYVRLLLNDIGLKVDVVPAYKISSATERGTAVDRTQLHNEFINGHLSQRQRGDVRLLKAFLKAHRIYGAEAKIEGFSGYLCELLIYHYGSFPKLLEAFSGMSLPVVINHGVKTIDANVEAKRFGKEFVVIDPTDSNRNVAANVSQESLLRLVFSSRKLLADPSLESFYGKPFSSVNSSASLAAESSALGTMYTIRFRIPDMAPDIIWQQLKRLRARLHSSLEDYGFMVTASIQGTSDSDALMSFFIQNDKLLSRVINGPSLGMVDAATKFVSAHSKSISLYADDGRIKAIEKPEHPTPESFLRAFLKSKKADLPSHLGARSATIHVGKLPEGQAKILYEEYCNRFSI